MSKEKEKLKFIFPNVMAKMMKKIDMRTQLESSMISMFLIMCSIMLMVFYLIFFGEVSIAYKIILLLNLGCGLLFISSNLITSYHQYISYMDVMGIDPEEHKREIRKKGNIFKRIQLAIRAKRLKKYQEGHEEKPLELVEEAVDRMVEIKAEELEERMKLENEAAILKSEEEVK